MINCPTLCSHFGIFQNKVWRKCGKINQVAKQTCQMGVSQLAAAVLPVATLWRAKCKSLCILFALEQVSVKKQINGKWLAPIVFAICVCVYVCVTKDFVV